MVRRIFLVLILAALSQSASNLYRVNKCRSRSCFGKVDLGPRWLFSKSVRPISILPEEAKRFR